MQAYQEEQLQNGTGTLLRVELCSTMIQIFRRFSFILQKVLEIILFRYFLSKEFRNFEANAFFTVWLLILEGQPIKIWSGESFRMLRLIFHLSKWVFSFLGTRTVTIFPLYYSNLVQNFKKSFINSEEIIFDEYLIDK